jgi:uncharacterized protein YecT (DUF1311 family)
MRIVCPFIARIENRIVTAKSRKTAKAMIKQRSLWVFLAASLIAHAASCQTATEQTFLYYARGKTIQLVYQQGEDNRGSIDIYEFRENGKYATLRSDVVSQSGSLVADKAAGDKQGISLAISPWPSNSAIQVNAVDRGQSFDASGEYQPLDYDAMRQTAAKHFSDADLELNIVYREVIGKLKPGNANAVRQFQREWANNRDDSAHTLVHFNYRDIESWDEQIEFELVRTIDTLDRIELLRGTPIAMSSPGITGTYSTNWGSTLLIDDQNGKVRFQISAFNRRNGSNGDLSGTARLRGKQIHWVDTQDPQPDPETGQTAEVTITFAPNRIATVESKNDESYHGAAIMFSGDYLRTSADRRKIEEGN